MNYTLFHFERKTDKNVKGWIKELLIRKSEEWYSDAGSDVIEKNLNSKIWNILSPKTYDKMSCITRTCHHVVIIFVNAYFKVLKTVEPSLHSAIEEDNHNNNRYSQLNRECLW